MVLLFHPSYNNLQRLSPITLKDLVTYNRQSSFIKEFPVPFIERGLKGITTDSEGNAWFYHSTNKSSTIIKFDVVTNKFTQYNVKGNTTVDNFIINLAGGQILYDNSRNVIWFTDARTNSIGKLDIKNSSSNNTSSSKVELFNIPTLNAGLCISVYRALNESTNHSWLARL